MLIAVGWPAATDELSIGVELRAISSLFGGNGTTNSFEAEGCVRSCGTSGGFWTGIDRVGGLFNVGSGITGVGNIGNESA